MAYRYFATDVFTGLLLADSLPLNVSSFGQRMNGIAGEMSADLVLGTGAKLADDVAVAALTDRPVAVWADRSGTLVWGGICWDTDWNSGSPDRIALKIQTFDSFLDKTEVRDGGLAVSVDKFAIMRELLLRAQSLWGQTVGIKINTAESSGVIDTLLYTAFKGGSYGQVMREYAAQDGGLEWCLDVSYDGLSRPQVVMRNQYPRLGSAGSGPTYEYPGSIVDYSWPSVYSTSANDIRAVGSGSEPDTVYSNVQVDSAALANGMIRSQRSTSYKDEDSVTILDAKAKADLRAMSGSAILPTITVRADTDPVFGSTRIGDDLRVRLTSQRHPAGPHGEPGFEGYLRCVGWDVHPPNESNSTDTVSLILAELPRYPRVPVPLGRTRQGSFLRELDRRVHNLEA